MKFLNYNGTELRLSVANYQSDPVVMAVMSKVADTGEPYGVFTVNLGSRKDDGVILKEGQSFVDTNNMPDIVGVLQENGLAEITGDMKQSGFCAYTLMQFDMDKLSEYVPQSELDEYKTRYSEAYDKLNARDRKMRFDDFDLGLDDEASFEGVYGPAEFYDGSFDF